MKCKCFFPTVLEVDMISIQAAEQQQRAESREQREADREGNKEINSNI
jgi:hypothetical protein